MTQKNYIPEGYDRIKVVPDLCAFLTTGFDPIANVVMYPRRLRGDFDLLSEKMAEYFKLGQDEIFIKYSELHRVREFQKTLDEKEMRECVEVILQDMEFLYHAGARPHFRILKSYNADETTHDFHVDGLLQDFDRYMTCYNEPVTQFIRNTDVLSVDGHKVIYRKDAEIFGFRAGDFWKSRVRNKRTNPMLVFWRFIIGEARKRAFVHRAQRSERPRLMVVADYRLDQSK